MATVIRSAGGEAEALVVAISESEPSLMVGVYLLKFGNLEVMGGGWSTARVAQLCTMRKGEADMLSWV